MSLPTNERIPNDINELSPTRQRHIRRQPRSGSEAERQILLESIAKLTEPTPAFFFRAFLGALAVGSALYFKSPALLIVAIVTLPFNNPLFGLAFFPITNNGKKAARSLVSHLILLSLTFTAGTLAGWMHPALFVDQLNIYHFSSLYWLHILILGISTVLITLIMVRQGVQSDTLGVLLSYILLIPFAISGFGLTNGQPLLWTGAGLVGLTHLLLALFLVMLTFLIIGFPPKDKIGWLIGAAILMLAMAFTSLSLHITQTNKPKQQGPSPVPTLIPISTQDSSQIIAETTLTSKPAAKPTLAPSPTASPTPAHTKTSTPTAQPTPYWGIIYSSPGAFIRENPSLNAQMVTTVNDGDKVEVLDSTITLDGTLWFHVRTQFDDVGWLLGELLITPTP